MAFSLSAPGTQSSHETVFSSPVINYSPGTKIVQESSCIKSGKGNQTAVVNSLGTQLSVLEPSSEPSIQAVSRVLLASPGPSLKNFLQDTDSVCHVFIFLSSSREIARAERVCKAFKTALNQKEQIIWKRQCAIYDVMIISAHAVTYKEKFLNSQPKMAYGAKEWAEYIGDVGKVPPISPKIHEVLKSPSPFWPKKTVEETCILVLIPATVDGKPLTLKTLYQLVRSPLKGAATGFRYISNLVRNKFGDTPVKESHWVLITKDVLPGSRNKKYAFQKQLVEKAGYKAPGLVDVSAAILLHQLFSGNRLFGANQWTYTRCQEQIDKYNLIVGGFAPSGLGVTYDYYGHDAHGIAGLLEV